jgi:hypothetical protein
MTTTMHLFLSLQALHDKLTVKPAGEEVLKTSIVTQKQERANGDVHIFRVLKDRDTFDCLLCYRPDEVVVHGTHCCELLPLAIAQLRPKTVKFEL